ncbi:malonyl-ACP O-methyltransferase BioC [Paraphotobacterium marinum]|uniref:malonyl-ACP O-methyltransferase BioC n=1 Tax=Paraphotobacterium marinum TaxID=1755811 RepID=UPI0039E8E32E
MLNNLKFVKKSFSAAVPHYDNFALLQQITSDLLISLIPIEVVNDRLICADLGAGTGYTSEKLSKLKIKNLTMIDLSQKMLSQCKNKFENQFLYLNADVNQLGIKDNTFDLICSNLMIQWSDNLDKTLSEINRVLKEQGTFFFSTLLPGSLIELDKSWKSVEQGDHINQFLPFDNLKKSILENNFQIQSLTKKEIKLEFNNPLEAMKSLKYVGANFVKNRQNKGLCTANKLTKMFDFYSRNFKKDNMVELSYQVCFGHVVKNSLNSSSELIGQIN